MVKSVEAASVICMKQNTYKLCVLIKKVNQANLWDNIGDYMHQTGFKSLARNETLLKEVWD